MKRAKPSLLSTAYTHPRFIDASSPLREKVMAGLQFSAPRFRRGVDRRQNDCSNCQSPTAETNDKASQYRPADA